MVSDLSFGGSARVALARGVKQLVRLVGVTLGPTGKNIVLQAASGEVRSTNDGATIARMLELPDAAEQLGVDVLRQAAIATDKSAGDGTSTAIVIAGELIEHGMRLLSAGEKPQQLVAGVRFVSAELQRRLKTLGSRQVGITELNQVASVACGNSEDGKLLAENLIRVGKTGAVSIQLGTATETSIETSTGYSFETGVIAEEFFTEAALGQSQVRDPYLLITDLEIDSGEQLLPVLNQVLVTGRPLVIIANAFSDDTRALLGSNQLAGRLSVVPVLAPGKGEQQSFILQDLAAITGGVVISAKAGDRLQQLRLNALGAADQVVADLGRTVVSGGSADAARVYQRITEVRGNLAQATDPYDREQQQLRLAHLAGVVTLVKVGGFTELERKERYYRMEDALRTLQAAIASGILPGGGRALHFLACQIEADLTHAKLSPQLSKGGRLENNAGFIAGIKLGLAAAKAPITRLLTNAGYPAQILLQRLPQDAAIGIDTRNGNQVNLLESGIIDPYQVTTQALNNAVSAACALLSVDALGTIPAG